MGRFAAVVAALLLIACGAANPVEPPPQVDAGALPSPSTLGVVGRQQLLNEAVDPQAVGAALDEAGFVAGAERIARDRVGRVRETSVRVLRFGDAAGATAWVEYAADHPLDVLGAVSAAGEIGDAAVYRHVPDGCCPGKDLTSWTAMAISGTLVTIVTVRGPDVTGDDLTAAMATAGLPTT